MTMEEFGKVRVYGQDKGLYESQQFVDQFGVKYTGTAHGASEYYGQQYSNCSIIVSSQQPKVSV